MKLLKQSLTLLYSCSSHQIPPRPDQGLVSQVVSWLQPLQQWEHHLEVSVIIALMSLLSVCKCYVLWYKVGILNCKFSNFVGASTSGASGSRPSATDPSMLITSEMFNSALQQAFQGISMPVPGESPTAAVVSLYTVTNSPPILLNLKKIKTKWIFYGM